MKHRFGSGLVSLGGVALLVVACAGSSFEGSGGAGAGSGGDSSPGTGGKTSAGASNGGASSAGKATGGSSSGGAEGGTSHGGVTTGGVTTGGSTTGGSSADPRACQQTSDCSACNYPTAPSKVSECYCPGCGDAPLSKAACTKNQTAWQKSCSTAPIICPAIACVEPPVPECKDNVCVVNN